MLNNFLTTADVMARLGYSRKVAIAFIRTHGGFKVWGMWVVERSKLEAVNA